jgi:hypothetical protein
MSWHGTTETPKIEVGSEYVTVTSKYSTVIARILRNETRDGTQTLTLDRMLDRLMQRYDERVDERTWRTWEATGVFVTVLSCAASVASGPHR